MERIGEVIEALFRLGTLEKLNVLAYFLFLLVFPPGTLILLGWSYWHPHPVTNFDVFWVGATIAYIQILLLQRGK